jgi:hypothetical protein
MAAGGVYQTQPRNPVGVSGWKHAQESVFTDFGLAITNGVVV